MPLRDPAVFAASYFALHSFIVSAEAASSPPRSAPLASATVTSFFIGLLLGCDSAKARPVAQMGQCPEQGTRCSSELRVSAPAEHPAAGKWRISEAMVGVLSERDADRGERFC